MPNSFVMRIEVFWGRLQPGGVCSTNKNTPLTRMWLLMMVGVGASGAEAGGFVAKFLGVFIPQSRDFGGHSGQCWV